MFSLDQILEELNKHIGDIEQDDVLKSNNPHPSDSIGILTDKLSCVCIQMWNNQEFLYAVRKMTPEQFKETYSDDLDRLHRMIKRCCDLNYQRSLLMDAIDKKAVEISNGHSR